jgi:hypothetical protein
VALSDFFSRQDFETRRITFKNPQTGKRLAS